MKFKDYLLKAKNALIVLLSLLAAVVVCMVVANLVQTDFGKVEIETGTIETTLEGNTINITYKLYTPKSVIEEHKKAPAALCLHGYQNDHETSAAYAIELARRGFETVY